MKGIKQFHKSLPLIHDIDRVARFTNDTRAELYALRTLRCAEISERLPTEKAAREGPLCLHASERQVCSQNGEDGVTAEIFRRIGHGRRVFAEIRIGDGVENNTAFFFSLGWTGFWMDAEPPRVRLTDAESQTLRFHRSFVTRENIAEQFTALGVPVDLDLLSIDIDQNTHYIWEAIPAWRARVVIVEYNATIPPSVDWRAAYGATRVWDGTASFGGSLKTFEKLGRDLGYALVHCEIVGSNAFFVRSDLLADHFLGPVDSETHFEPPRFELIYQGGHGASPPRP